VRSDPLILLVEHEPDVRSIFVEFLTERGYRVVSAGDLPVGTAMLRAMCPDLLITERLPNGDGRELEKLARNMNIPVLLISTVPQFVQARGVAFLQKPFGLRDLQREVEKLLRLVPA
jgi:DNA-binding response OmpR family regulator